MKFESELKKILEDFNITPMAQGAPSTGSDQGMTVGDPYNTFPSKSETVGFSLNRKKLKRLKKKAKQ